MTSLLAIKNVTKNYWDTKEETKRPHLFSDITAALQKSERVTLLGTSGQGKSTLLRILALLESADSGEIHFNGTSYTKMDARTWRMKICYVAQQSVMLPGTIEDNLKMISKLHSSIFEEDFARKLMNQVGLEHLDWAKQATDLSGGEKQRVALVRSLLLRPAILLLDEITASLDQKSKEHVEQLLMHMSKEDGVSFIWVTHDIEQARKVSERVWLMDDGKIVRDLETEEFFNEQSVRTSKVTV
ncbi:ATP-binding cassette domain-containing protein [Psychrobacillus sp.]|uniref:ABC transporter ATP-binding protein n=1 Tax=Psychrobacillus sp. TaxID=1871623 RepID=UPI0028BDDF66|nr:ATP-binding cassette domain-containing protein [Psychrobacillus sp.]